MVAKVTERVRRSQMSVEHLSCALSLSDRTRAAKYRVALKGCGGDVRFTVYPDAGHDSWTETYDNPELYGWFLQHRRPGVHDSS